MLPGPFRNKISHKRRRRLLNSILMMDQTNLKAGSDLRRYAMKPTPAKPRIIIAQVEGSGTAASCGVNDVCRSGPGAMRMDSNEALRVQS